MDITRLRVALAALVLAGFGATWGYIRTIDAATGTVGDAPLVSAATAAASTPAPPSASTTTPASPTSPAATPSPAVTAAATPESTRTATTQRQARTSRGS